MSSVRWVWRVLGSGAALFAASARADVCTDAFVRVAAPRATSAQRRIALLTATHVHHTSDGGGRWTSFAARIEEPSEFLVDDDGTTVALERRPGHDRLRVLAPDGAALLDARDTHVHQVDAAFGIVAYVTTDRVSVSRDRGRTFATARVAPSRFDPRRNASSMRTLRDVRVESSGVVRVLEIFEFDQNETQDHRPRAYELRCAQRASETCERHALLLDDVRAASLMMLAPNGVILDDLHQGYSLLRGGAFRPLVPQPRRRRFVSRYERSVLFEYSPSTVWRLDGETFSTLATAIPVDRVDVALDTIGRLLVALPTRLLRRDSPHSWTSIVECARRSP
jgi:hypothetical protein